MKKVKIFLIGISFLMLFSCTPVNTNSDNSLTGNTTTNTDSSGHTHSFDNKIWEYNIEEHWHPATCGHDVKSNIEKHTFKEIFVDPTYESEGYTKYECKVCDYSYKDNFIGVLNHNYSEILSYDEKQHWYPCIDAGYEHLRKSVENHSFIDTVISPTYYSEGYTLHKCKKCDYSYKDNYINVITFTVTWKNWDGKILEIDKEVKYGKYPSYDGDEPKKESDEIYDYIFKGWNKELEPIKEDTEYIATFESIQREEFLYNQNGNSYSIYKYVGTSPVVTLPKTHNGKTITSIESNTFKDSSFVKELSILSESIILEKGCLTGLTQLEKLTTSLNCDGRLDCYLGYLFGASIYTENYSYVPKKLKKLFVVNTKELIETAFYQCANLLCISISYDCEFIPEGVFFGCSSLKEISLPFTGSSFSSNEGLGYVFGRNSFSYSTLIQQNKIDYYIPTALEKVMIEGGNIEGAFCNCTTIQDINLLSKVEDIVFPSDYSETLNTSYSGTFNNCIGLKHLYFSPNVKLGEPNLLAQCIHLEVLEIGVPYYMLYKKGTNMYSTDRKYEYYNIGKLFYTYKASDDYKKIEQYYTEKEIGGINNWSKSETYYIPKTLSKVVVDCDGGFTGNYTLQNLYFCDTKIYNFNEIGIKPISNTRIDSFDFPINITEVTEGFFAGCTFSDNTYSFSNNITILDKNVFRGCDTIEYIKLPSNISKICDFVFWNCSSLKYMILPSSLKELGDLVFYYCSNLTIYCYQKNESQAKTIFGQGWNCDCKVYYLNEWSIDADGEPYPNQN